MWCCFMLILVVEGGRCRSGFGWYVLQWFVTGKKEEEDENTNYIKRFFYVGRGRSIFE